MMSSSRTLSLLESCLQPASFRACPAPLTGKKVADYWDAAKRLLMDSGFLARLKEYDRDNIAVGARWWWLHLRTQPSCNSTIHTQAYQGSAWWCLNARCAQQMRWQCVLAAHPLHTSSPSTCVRLGPTITDGTHLPTLLQPICCDAAAHHRQDPQGVHE